MHIALLDENVADRKQLERLLGREADKRKDENGIHYVDSFGEGQSLFPKRMSYDLFFLDGSDSKLGAYNFAIELCNGGVTAPIVLCSAIEGYETSIRDKYTVPSNILFLKKPVLKADLSNILDRAEIIFSKLEPTIELRYLKDTMYVRPYDIICVRLDHGQLFVSLNSDETVEVTDSISSLTGSLATYDYFIQVSKNLIINAKYIEKLNMLSVRLKNGFEAKISPLGRSEIKKAITHETATSGLLDGNSISIQID